eukprot:GEMP01063714.1.p1 GENE.GEMP01063714.1~~GEMP01063714.1.p1  ORF type:complete len:116 (+),score=14.01 GEMP01063714.1:39-386(+)
MAHKTAVDAFIKQNPLMVFAKGSCPSCMKARAVLDNTVGASRYKIIDLEKPDYKFSMASYQDYLRDLTGGRSVPRVFIGGKFIGGGDDVAELQKSGKLVSLLQAAGVPVKSATGM